MPIVRSSGANGSTYDRQPASAARVDALMTSEEFAEQKRVLMRTLRAPGDAPPRRMKCSPPSDIGYLETLRRCLQTHPGARLVRGFKLLQVPLSKSVWGATSAWKACFHCVIELPSERGAVDCLNPYVDPNGPTHVDPNEPARVSGADGADGDEPARARANHSDQYIFLPSSRIHAALTDEQLLSGNWFFGTVVGGCSSFAIAVSIEQSVKGRRVSVVATTPEKCVAKRRVKIRPLPHFLEWCSARAHPESPIVIGELCGFPVYEPHEHIDENDVERMLSSACGNPEALLDGYETLLFELTTRARILAGEITPGDTRALFFRRFDDLYAEMTSVRKARLQARFSEAGFKTQHLA